jgi:hypothetical protein
MKISLTITSVIIAATLLSSSPAVWAGEPDLIGVWGLISLWAEDAQTSSVPHPMWGEHPIGLLNYSPGGHMSAVLMAQGRKPMSGVTDKRLEEFAQMFTTMSSYAGTYTVQGSTVTHHVAVAGDPSWVGKEQVRFVDLDNRTLTVSTPPILNPSDGKTYKIVAVWKRLE